MTTVYLNKSTKLSKKLMATLVYANGRRVAVHFGATGYSDYTIHKDEDRMNRYTKRHKSREDEDTEWNGNCWVLEQMDSLDETNVDGCNFSHTEEI